MVKLSTPRCSIQDDDGDDVDDGDDGGNFMLVIMAMMALNPNMCPVPDAGHGGEGDADKPHVGVTVFREGRNNGDDGDEDDDNDCGMVSIK
jgi:hypothetical protein